MRVLALLGIVAGCSDGDPVKDRIDELDAKTEVFCARYQQGGIPYIPIEQAVACMNDALASGGRAHSYWVVKDEKGYDAYTYVFTVDHQILAFESNADPFSGEDYYDELPTCTGPFRVGERISVTIYVLGWDGCP